MQFSDIKGFGEKRIAVLKAAGFTSPEDLITYFPLRYIDTSSLTRLEDASEGDRVVVCACTHETPKVAYIRKRLNLVKVKFIYDDKTVWCSWFNQPFMAKNIVPNRYYYIAGKLKKFKSTYEIVAPELIKFTGNEPPVIPVYKPIGKINSGLISEAIKAALGAVSVDSYIPQSIAEKYELGNIDKAFSAIHFPRAMSEVYAAQRLLSIERLSYMLAAYSLIKAADSDSRAYIYKDKKDKVNELIGSLPYSLTGAQKRCLDALLCGFTSDKKVNALLEGDVGSGKTVVAMLCMYFAAMSGYQSALMAPTEILAAQHYRNAIGFLEKHGLRCGYISGSMNRREREEALFNIAVGNYDCIFGTHALMSDDVRFKNLSLVIIDEQHRFGVAQRAALENKSQGADSIVMSATPIPRTLALTLYADLDRLVIDELPSGKARINTRFVPPEREKGMWDYIAAKAAAGEQTYVVVPKITSDDDDGGCSAEAVYERYKSRFGDVIALVHGKQKESERSENMRKFAAGEIKILVATTVIEVGIDVANATTMVIYDSDRFGLSQLHQLRGRVGRGKIDSYCFVLTSAENPETRARLEKFIACSDGFELAEFDFLTRGAGDFIGYNQHGNGGSFPSDPGLIALCKVIKDDLLLDFGATEKIRDSLTCGRSEFFNKLTLN